MQAFIIEGNIGLAISMDKLNMTQIFAFQFKYTDWAFMVSKRYNTLFIRRYKERKGKDENNRNFEKNTNI